MRPPAPVRVIALLLVSSVLGCTGEADPETDVRAVDPAVDASVDAARDAGATDAMAEPEGDAQVGFEILEVQSPNSIRAWISPTVTFDEFTALEVPMGWLKNQPREAPDCQADTVRFLRSPDGEEEGDILIQEHFGFDWFHSATVVETDVPLDEAGLLRGFRVRKFHELTFEAGRCMVLLTSPEGEVYYRVGRDVNRMSDAPTLPPDWEIRRHTTTEPLVIQLFDETLVIRTDNEDSFQGPVPQLRGEL